ncbi:MAG: hypothetical protein HY544_04960 [Candidatus Diapherotrites archaeon]|uniref:Uncharacterized protein n=1 Tax=Candidatus Iainarchaeum sp. TaxID=3101447 RepID=A0A8T3YMA4_9ARCH|nr:hypothetical protein [Candidatus Diapherotrites archaeon]
MVQLLKKQIIVQIPQLSGNGVFLIYPVKRTPKGRSSVENILKELTNDEWIVILAKRTGKGSEDHVSLNPRKVSEIKQHLQSMNSQK